MLDDPRRPAADSGGVPSLAEVIEVLRPHVEKIEEGFHAIRLALDALSEHLSRVPAAAADKTAKRPAASTPLREPPPPREPQEEVQPRPVVRAAPPTVAAHETPPAMPVASAEPPPLQAAEPPPLAAPVAVAAPPPVAPPAPVRAAPAPTGIPVTGGAGAGNWSQIVFGLESASNPAVAYLSGRLLSEVYAGDNDARGLVGQLMDFRSANSERKLRMLKDVGEAFYRWKPTGDERLRDALIAWVHALLERESIPNRITMAQVGDRYDMQAHNAKERGVEVAEVYGWVVLRDNGKVYSKANVSVR
jgi:hypothetical protein